MVGQTAFGWYASSDSAYIHKPTVQVKRREVWSLRGVLSRVNFVLGGECMLDCRAEDFVVMFHMED